MMTDDEMNDHMHHLLEYTNNYIMERQFVTEEVFELCALLISGLMAGNMTHAISNNLLIPGASVSRTIDGLFKDIAKDCIVKANNLINKAKKEKACLKN